LSTHGLKYGGRKGASVSKYALAREMLAELAELLPKGYPVYVLFDSWYASAKLIKFCRRQRSDHWRTFDRGRALSLMHRSGLVTSILQRVSACAWRGDRVQCER
jgi:hypothetical protein